MKYDPFANTARLQKKNMGEIVKFITGVESNTAVSRGEDIDYESPITQILEQWADGVVKELNRSWIDKGFNPDSSTIKSIAPIVIDKAGTIKALQINYDEGVIWADRGRGPTKNGHTPGTPYLYEHIQKWIAYRGINLSSFKSQKVMVKTEGGKKVARYPYRNISNIEANKALSKVIAQSIHRKGTIKRFGYKGSKFLTDVINQESLNALAQRCSEALGEEISITLVQL